MIKLLDLYGSVVAETATDEHGNYKFENVPIGEYKIMGVAPDGTEFTIKDAGHDDKIDSDVNDNGMSDVISISVGKSVEVDLGVCEIEVGKISGTVFCDTDCDGEQEISVITTKGANILKNSHFENGNHTDYNVKSFGSWYDVGYDTADIVTGKHEGHHGNSYGNEIVELDKGAIWCQQVNVAQAGTYCLTFDVYKNGYLSDHDNSFKVKINGVTIETVEVSADGTVELMVDLEAGHHQIDFKSLSYCSGKGTGIDNIVLRQEIQAEIYEEPVKEGATINLLDGAGNIVATTTTDADGNYHFGDVRVGDYTSQGIAPDGTEFAPKDAAADDVDSDVGADGKSDMISVTKDSETDIDLGLCEKDDPASIAGR